MKRARKTQPARMLALIVVATATMAVSEADAQEASSAPGRPSLKLGNAVQVEFQGLLQLDARSSVDDRAQGAPGDERGLDVARKRVGIQGRVARSVGFELDAEVGDSDPWRDVYVDYRQFRAIRARAGRFKVPFSLDHTTSSADLDFIDRSRAATRVAPGRDQGVMAHGRILNDRLKYELGTFADGRTTAVRFSSRPFSRASLLGKMDAAVAFTDGEFGERLVESVWVNGTHRRTGLELRWQPGWVVVTAEYMRGSIERRGQSTTNEDLPPLTVAGWYVAGTWSWRPVVRSTRTRVELATRIERLRVGNTDAGGAGDFSPRAAVAPRHGEGALTIGVNWYVTRWVKFQVNGVREAASVSGARSGASRWTPQARLQISM